MAKAVATWLPFARAAAVGKFSCIIYISILIPVEGGGGSNCIMKTHQDTPAQLKGCSGLYRVFFIWIRLQLGTLPSFYIQVFRSTPSCLHKIMRYRMRYRL